MQQFHKTRIAPTPSGYLHLGNAYSFALTAALAKRTGAKTLLRIDDLDQQRVSKPYVQDIFDTLRFLGIDWEEGPRDLPDYENNWSQLHRMARYKTMLQRLKESGDVFACTCSRTQIKGCTCRSKNISLDTPNANWRLKTHAENEIAVKTLNDGIIKTALPASMNEFIVRKKDGHPSYQLASLADDLFYGIDLVVRGADLWPSTIAQHYLADILQEPAFAEITFHHHHLLMETRDKKLSKSAGATSIKYLREQGKTAGDIFEEIGRMMGFTGDLRSF